MSNAYTIDQLVEQPATGLFAYGERKKGPWHELAIGLGLLCT
jgi:hypothetical protein